MKSINNVTKKIFLVFIIVITIFTAGIYFFKHTEPVSQPILTANFIDLAKVEKISKYRSCQGHTVVPQDESESARNMKHYVILKPEYVGGNKVEVYSPISGIVSSTRAEPQKGLEGEIWLGNKDSNWAVSIQHLVILDSIKEGKKVKAGEIIGHVANNGIDVVYGVGAGNVKTIDGYQSPYLNLDSPFNHINESVLALYQAKGIEKADLIYSKEYRDQNPCKYRDERGGLNDIDHPEDWVKI